jgi:hypothetical protein
MNEVNKQSTIRTDKKRIDNVHEDRNIMRCIPEMATISWSVRPMRWNTWRRCSAGETSLGSASGSLRHKMDVNIVPRMICKIEQFISPFLICKLTHTNHSLLFCLKKQIIEFTGRHARCLLCIQLTHQQGGSSPRLGRRLRRIS